MSRSAGYRRGHSDIRGVLRHNEPLAPHTSWKVGGPADRYFEPADREDLLQFIASLPPREPLLWLGLGSNLLVRDGGFRGTVICLHGALDGLASAGDFEIYAEAGVHCARLAKYAQSLRRAGLGFMAGIPGTVGGALAMNAGAWGGVTWSQVVAVEAVYAGGRSEWLAPEAFHYEYRQVQSPPGVIGFLGARFRVDHDDSGEYERQTRESLAQRKATQPVGKPTAGSTFRNPPGDHAARLIESCGCKGLRIGGAEVSSLHANFIVTDASASAADVEALIQRIRQIVLERCGIELEPEVKMVGEYRDAGQPAGETQ